MNAPPTMVTGGSARSRVSSDWPGFALAIL